MIKQTCSVDKWRWLLLLLLLLLLSSIDFEGQLNVFDFFFNGGGLSIGGEGGNEENFLRKAAIGGNSTPRNVFDGICSWLDLFVVSVFVQRSWSFFSFRDLTVANGSIIVDDEPFIVKDVCCCSMSSVINPEQIFSWHDESKDESGLIFVGLFAVELSIYWTEKKIEKTKELLVWFLLNTYDSV